MLGEECLDWDIVTEGDAPKTARQLADTLGGHYVRMHARASRVIVVVEDTGSSHTRKEICFDISPLIGKTIEDDLRQRDFTINAIAAPLDEVVRYLEIEMASQPHHNEAHSPYRKGAPLLYNEGTNSNIVGAPLAGALGGWGGYPGGWDGFPRIVADRST